MVHEHLPGSRRFLTPCGLALLIAVSIGLGCGWRESEKAPEQKTGEVAPGMIDLLELMPDSAVTVLATPSLRDLGERLEAFLLRASPESINMEAEIRVVVQQLGRAVNVPDARHLEDIAVAKGIDPERPCALYATVPPFPEPESGDMKETGDSPDRGSDDEIKSPSPDESARPPEIVVEPVSIERDVYARPPVLTDVPQAFAVAAYSADRTETERFMLDLADNARMNSESVPESNVELRVGEEGRFAYFFSGDLIVFGNRPALVRDIARRLSAPARVRYGTDECPAHADDVIVQLTRLDALTKLGAEAEESLPLQANASLTNGVEELKAAFSGTDPMVTAWRVAETQLDAVTRFDLKTHPNAAEWRGAPHPLSHLAVLPKDTAAVLSFDFGGKSRDLVVEGAQTSLSAGVDPDSPMGSLPGNLGRVLSMLGDTLTLAVSGSETKQPAVVLLAEFQNGEEARTQLRDMGMMPLVSETYNGIDLYLLPLPVPIGEGVHYALPGNTLVMGTEVSTLKTLIDLLTSGRESSWCGAQQPPVDPGDPLLSALIVKPQSLAALLVPTLESQGAVSPEAASTGGLIWENVDDLRFVTRVQEEWQEGHLTVTLQ